jgi:hypothetical protein
MSSLVTAALAASRFVGVLLPLSAQYGQRRVVAVDVVDRDGNQVPMLTAADFRGEFRGQPVTIQSAAPATSARRVAMIVDTSGRAERSPSGFVWSTTENLIRRLTPDHGVRIFTVTDTLRSHSDLSTDVGALQEGLNEAKGHPFEGGSSLYDGMLAAGRAIARGELGDVICLISDGEDTTSYATARDVEIALVRSGIRLFWIRMGAAIRSERLADIIEATGGLVFEPGRPGKDVDGELGSLHRLITQVYRLELALPRAVDKPRRWTLELIGPNGQKRKDVRLAYPRLLVPSSAK